MKFQTNFTHTQIYTLIYVHLGIKLDYLFVRGTVVLVYRRIAHKYENRNKIQ